MSVTPLQSIPGTARSPGSPTTDFIACSVIAGVIAAVASYGIVVAGFALWAMFIGWTAYSTSGTSLRQSLIAGLCLWLGIMIGAAAVAGVGGLAPIMGSATAVAVVVFVVAAVVVSMRALPVVGDIHA